MNRRDFTQALLASGAAADLLLASAPAHAQRTPVDGRDYTRLDPPQPVAPGKIEVIEFFSYACPHCAAFEPVLHPWVKTLPADVQFKRVPVPFLAFAETFQRTYYTLEAMGLVDALQGKVFNAVHNEHQRFDKVEDAAAWVGRNGGDAKVFASTWASFSVASNLSRAKKMTGDYQVNSIPTLVVQGRFVTSPSQANGAPEALQVIDALIRQVRK